MNSKQIFHALHCNKITNEFFDGVYSADRLEEIVLRPQLVVANTDPSWKKDQHWVLFLFHKKSSHLFRFIWK